jgi:addiction module RelB/DinJ family antitoxin
MAELMRSEHMESININILPEDKREAERILNQNGLTLSEAINLFINHICEDGYSPFCYRNDRKPNAETLEAMRECEELLNDPATKWYDDVDELFADCLEGYDIDSDKLVLLLARDGSHSELFE